MKYLAYFNAGRALEGLQRVDDAMRAYQQALEIVPDAESATVALTSLQFMRDERDAAVSAINRVFNRKPGPARSGPSDRLRQFLSLGRAKNCHARCPETGQIVTRGRGSFLVAAIAGICGDRLPRLDAKQAVFRARTESVAISASVKRGNAPVANLTANDFRLTDNGVPQSIEAVTIESVPLDVTLFMDTSGSTAGALDRMKSNVITIAKMLRPDDQFRLMTIGLSVDTPVPWQRAGSPISLDMKAVPGISLVYDALFVALTHTPATGRRHLIVAMTDGEDCGSLLDGARVLDASGRSEAVLHWIYVSNQGDFDQLQHPGVVHADAMPAKSTSSRRARHEPAAIHIDRDSAIPRSGPSRRSSMSSGRATCCDIRRRA